jgi:hypothetical protein
LKKINGKGRIASPGSGIRRMLRLRLGATAMAQIDIEHFDVKARPLSALEVAQEISRTKQMLVVTIVGTMIIVVVAVLFMTIMS